MFMCVCVYVCVGVCVIESAMYQFRNTSVVGCWCVQLLKDQDKLVGQFIFWVDKAKST